MPFLSCPGCRVWASHTPEMLDCRGTTSAYPAMCSPTNLGAGLGLGRQGEKQIRLCLPPDQKINQLLYESSMETEGGVTCVEISADVKLKQK